MLVKEHVEVTNKVVAFLACGFGSGAFAPFQPCQHGFAYVYAAVVDNVGLDHTVTACFQYFGQRITEQVVAHVAQMQGFVGVGR